MSVDSPFMVAVALKDTDEMVGEIVVLSLSICSMNIILSGNSSVSLSRRMNQAWAY